MGSCRIEERAITLTIAQHAVPQDSSYWAWSVWIEGTNAELDNVEEVIWKLHPTFSPQLHRVKSRANKFKLETSGWGEFTIHAQIKTKNGRSKSVRHWLKLEEGTKPPKPSATASGKVDTAHPERNKNSRPAIFLSYSLNNANLAAHLTKALKKGKYTVTRDVDIPAGEEVRRWIRDQIAKSDAVVLLGADEMGMSSPEIQIAQSAGVPVIPVTFGGSPKSLPTALGKVKALRAGAGDVEKIVPNLAQQIGELLP